MNAIEIRNLTKSFGKKNALNGLNMTVPKGSIYGLIGENGSGKSTTEKLICGLIVPNSGEIRLFKEDYTNPEIRARIGVLIEQPGCFPNYSVWNNLLLQAKNLSIPNAKEEVRKVLKIVRMEGSASNKYKNCSLGMKQRIGIAMALLGNPILLILDEPINGLDVDGMRIMREVLIDITNNYSCTVVISSHVLGELGKIATHYGIVKDGKMIKEMTSDELNKNCRNYISLKSENMTLTRLILEKKFIRVIEENENLRIYDDVLAEEVVDYLYENNIVIKEITTNKINLEEYYIDLMNKEVK